MVFLFLKKPDLSQAEVWDFLFGEIMKKLFAVGTGPGASDLLTLRALKAIEQAQVVFAPNNRGKNMALDTASQYLEEKKVVLLDFPMGQVRKEDYKKAARIIENEITSLVSGVFLTIGDPMIYSTFIYIMEALDESLEIEIVPGIPSFLAAAAASKTPLTKKGESFTLMDSYKKEIADVSDSLVILKTMGNKEELIDSLDEDFIYNYVRKVSLDDEFISRNKEEILKDKSYMSLVLARREKRSL